MGRASPSKVQRYSLEFKRQAMKLSKLEDVEVQQAGSEKNIKQRYFAEQ
jgi:hypothetical protein